MKGPTAKKLVPIMKIEFCQSRYSRIGYGYAAIQLQCGHQVFRKWSQRPKGSRMTMPCSECPKEKENTEDALEETRQLG